MGQAGGGEGECLMVGPDSSHLPPCRMVSPPSPSLSPLPPPTCRLVSPSLSPPFLLCRLVSPEATYTLQAKNEGERQVCVCVGGGGRHACGSIGN